MTVYCTVSVNKLVSVEPPQFCEVCDIEAERVIKFDYIDDDGVTTDPLRFSCSDKTHIIQVASRE